VGNVLTRPFREISVNQKGRGQEGGWDEKRLKMVSRKPVWMNILKKTSYIGVNFYAQFLNTHPKQE